MIRNPNDNLCLPRALVCGIWLVKSKINGAQKRASEMYYKRVCKGGGNTSPDLQLEEALKLCRDAGVDPATVMGSLDDIRAF